MYAPPPPVPVLPLPQFDGPDAPYAAPPPRERRPKAVTLLGVGAIVVACVGFLTSVAMGVGAIVFLAAGDAAGRTLALDAANRAVQPPPAPPPAVEATSPKGMSPAERKLVIDAMKYLEPITPAREEQLDAMLAKAGSAIFPPHRVRRTRQGYQAAVLDHGELYSADPNRPGPIFFVTSTGRVEVHDERAFFQPGDRSGTVRTFAGGAAGASGLTPVQVTDVIRQAQALTSTPLNPAQVSTLTALLSQPQQALVPAHRAKSAVKSVLVRPGGASVQFVGGAVELGPQGQIVPTGRLDPPRVNRVAFGFTLAGSVALLALAVHLFVAALLTLGRSPAPGKCWRGMRGRRSC
jgi:hypothetical protein